MPEHPCTDDGDADNLGQNMHFTTDTLDILTRLEVNPQTGLSDDSVQQRLVTYGPNEVRETRHQSAIIMFLEQFKGVMSLLLVAAGIISTITGDTKDTIVISAVIILNAVMGFVQEYRAEKAIAALKKLAEPFARVIRNGQLTEIHSHLLVPGDIIRLQAGDITPADGRLLEAVNLTADEAPLTGESLPVDKNALFICNSSTAPGDRKCDVFMGTTMTQGRGTFVVTNTGMHTEIGKIAAMIEQTPVKQTPLQQRLAQLGLVLAIGVIIICIIVFAAGVIQGRDMKVMLLASISLAVAAVPESLPAVITISLALGAQRMVKGNALIRKLPAVETLGCVTTICTDKTGTLTQNRMQVENIYTGDGVFPYTDKGFIDIDAKPDEGLPAQENKSLKTLLEVFSLCNDTEIQVNKDQTIKTLGDPTETSLVEAAIISGLNIEEAKRRLQRMAEIPFDSKRKRMTTIHRTQDGSVYAFIKGALDVILQNCSSEMKDGYTVSLSDARSHEITKSGEQYAARGARIIAAAFRELNSVPDTISSETVENDLVFLGFAAISDPPRPEAAEAVAKCKSGGIRVVMITGDHTLTAKAIGMDLGIVDSTDPVSVGNELDSMDDAKFTQTAAECRIFARVSPEHKARIVAALQDNGQIVAMTGDGVNDAPSLKRADVGVAMGITGTDVSREASDIVLTDDNFATIVSAVEEGRTIYDNLRKFVRYMLATNLGEVLTMFCGMLSGLPLPLLAIQILWVNLVTDGLPALALGVEPAEGDVMKRPPRPPKESLFARGLLFHILWVGILIAIGTLSVYAIALQHHEVEYARTLAFYTLAVFQLFQVMAIRRERESAFKTKLNTNRFLTLSVFGTLVLQILITYIRPVAAIFRNVPVSPADIAICTLVCSSVLFAVEFEKKLNRRHYAY